MSDLDFELLCACLASFVVCAVVAWWRTVAEHTRRRLDEHGPPPGRLADRLVGHLTETRQRAGIQPHQTRELS